MKKKRKKAFNKNCENVRMATWNPWGMCNERLNYCKSLNYDILGLPELGSGYPQVAHTHKWPTATSGPKHGSSTQTLIHPPYSPLLMFHIPPHPHRNDLISVYGRYLHPGRVRSGTCKYVLTSPGRYWCAGQWLSCRCVILYTSRTLWCHVDACTSRTLHLSDVI